MRWLKMLVSILWTVVKTLVRTQWSFVEAMVIALLFGVEKLVQPTDNRFRPCLESLEDRTLLSALYFNGDPNTPKNHSDNWSVPNAWFDIGAKKVTGMKPQSGDLLLFGASSKSSVDDIKGLSDIRIQIDSKFSKTITLEKTLEIDYGFMDGGTIIGQALDKENRIGQSQAVGTVSPSLEVLSGGKLYLDGGVIQGGTYPFKTIHGPTLEADKGAIVNLGKKGFTLQSGSIRIAPGGTFDMFGDFKLRDSNIAVLGKLTVYSGNFTYDTNSSITALVPGSALTFDVGDSHTCTIGVKLYTKFASRLIIDSGRLLAIAGGAIDSKVILGNIDTTGNPVLEFAPSASNNSLYLWLANASFQGKGKVIVDSSTVQFAVDGSQLKNGINSNSVLSTRSKRIDAIISVDKVVKFGGSVQLVGQGGVLIGPGNIELTDGITNLSGTILTSDLGPQGPQGPITVTVVPGATLLISTYRSKSVVSTPSLGPGAKIIANGGTIDIEYNIVLGRLYNGIPRNDSNDDGEILKYFMAPNAQIVLNEGTDKNKVIHPGKLVLGQYVDIAVDPFYEPLKGNNPSIIVDPNSYIWKPSGSGFSWILPGVKHLLAARAKVSQYQVEDDATLKVGNDTCALQVMIATFFRIMGEGIRLLVNKSKSCATSARPMALRSRAAWS